MIDNQVNGNVKKIQFSHNFNCMLIKTYFRELNPETKCPVI